MSWVLSLSAALALAAAEPAPKPGPMPEQSPEPKLEPLLDALNQDELSREARACKLTERTVIEELDDDGERKGKVMRESVLEQRPSGPRRTIVSERFEGDPSGVFKERPKDEKPQPGPFHPSQRPHYRYTLETTEGAKTAVIRFAPKKPDAKRMQGTATVELSTGKLVELSVVPSKNPALVDELRMKVSLRDTACGRQPVHAWLEGRGGLPLMKMRFRTETTLTGHGVVGG